MATLNYNYQKVGENYCGNGGGTNVYIRLYAKLNSQSIANNNSSVNLQTRVYFSGNLQTSNVHCTTDGTSVTVASGSVSYTRGNEYTLQTVTRTIGHQANGTSGTISKGCSWSSYYSSVNGSTTGSFTLPTIPRQANLTSADNFNDEENPTIKYTNSAGNSVSSLQACISLTGAKDDVKYRDIPKTGNTYIFNLTDEERDLLRSATPTSNSLAVKFYVKTVLGGNTYYSILDRTMTIVNGNPTFTDFDYQDSNSTVTQVVGSNKVFVKNKSNLQVIISSDNKMTANKQSTPKNYVATLDDKNVSADYSEEALTLDLGVIKNPNTKRLNVRAYDSRNNSSLVYKDIDIYDYDSPVINFSVSRLNNFEDTTTVSVEGTFNKLMIPNNEGVLVSKNTINSLQYRYREVNGEWGNWIDLTYSLEDNKFTCTDVILSLDNTKAFEFEIKAVDKLDTVIVSRILDVGQAIFMISSNQKKCYINGQEILMYQVVDEW